MALGARPLPGQWAPPTPLLSPAAAAMIRQCAGRAAVVFTANPTRCTRFHGV